MSRILESLKNNLIWLKTNAESVVALGLAISMSFLGLVDLLPSDLVNKTIPLTLGVIAFAMLRERWRQESVNTLTYEAVTEVTNTVRLLHEQAERTNLVMTSTQRTLDGLAAVRVAVGDEVSKALAEARVGTDRWIFKGGTGAYARVVTLPACLSEARRERREFRIQMEILDPTNQSLCHRYAELYRTLAEQDDDAQTWTAKGTQIELYSTILAACLYKQKLTHLLDIKIGLASTVSTFRWDLSSRYLIVTQRGPRFPAMIVERGHPYYDCWNTELRTSFGECRSIPMERAREIPLDGEPGAEEVRELFHRLDLDLPDDYQETDVRDIIEKAIRDTNPFVRGAGDNLMARQAHFGE